jgi:hypothetical protein
MTRRPVLAFLFVIGCAREPEPRAPIVIVRDCPQQAPPAPPPTAAAPPLTCGQFALREARLVAGGKGDKHPELLAVRARLAECGDKRPTEAECLDVRRKSEELQKVYGPKHPEMVMSAAELAVCEHP